MLRRSDFFTYPGQIASCLRDRLGRKIRKEGRAKGPVHLMFMFADHFEPVSDLARVDDWIDDYRSQVEGHFDSEGRPPQHTWFYPCEQLEPSILNRLSLAAFEGLGEVELHLHHKNDTRESLRAQLETALSRYMEAGCFTGFNSERPRYGFVHGNFALANSRGDHFCGVNDEITILKETGCYADFTFPSNEPGSEPHKLNSIYYAPGSQGSPKSYDSGADARAGIRREEDLMLVEGPYIIDWRRRKLGLFPYIECADIAHYCKPARERIPLWIKAGVHVLERPEWLFIKVHGHGANRKNIPVLLSGEMEELYHCLETEYNDGEKYLLHYVTTREAYNIIRAAEDGRSGDSGAYRDYEIEKPLNRSLYSSVPYELKTGERASLEFSGGPASILIRKEGGQAELEGKVRRVYFHPDHPRSLELLISGDAIISSPSALTLKGNFLARESSVNGRFEYRLRANAAA